MVINNIRKCIDKYKILKKGQHVILGLSGGPDSVCLFFALRELSEKLGFTMSAVHVNHNFRGREADNDELFVKKLCEDNGIKIKLINVDCNKIAKLNKISSEEAGRIARYEAFTEEALSILDSNEYGITSTQDIKIAVAQNKNDQVETILMRIMRGTGVNGLAGIFHSRKGEHGIDIIRPLLTTTKKEVLTFCESNKIDFCVDKTNEQSIYTRNKIRLDLIPYIEETFNENIVEAIWRLGELAKEDKAYFDNILRGLEKHFEKENFWISIDMKWLENLDEVILKRLIIYMAKIIKLEQGLSEIHIASVVEMVKSDIQSWIIDLPKGYKVAYSYNKLRIYDSEKIKSIDIKNEFRCKIISKSDISNDEKNKIMIDIEKVYNNFNKNIVGKSEKIPKEDLYKLLDTSICIRYRKEGDYISLGENKGSKKIKKLLVDEKTFREKRENIPLVAINSEIICILGDEYTNNYTGMSKSRISKLYTVNEDTKMILRIESLCEI